MSSPSQLTDTEVQELQRLCDEATPGPWAFDTDWCDCGGEYGCSHGEFPYAINVPSIQVPWGFAAHKPDASKHAAEIVDEFGENATLADGEFIAAARTALPRLLKEREALHTLLRNWIQGEFSAQERAEVQNPTYTSATDALVRYAISLSPESSQ